MDKFWRTEETYFAVEGPKLLLNQGPSEPCYATDVVDARKEVLMCLHGIKIAAWLHCERINVTISQVPLNNALVLHNLCKYRR